MKFNEFQTILSSTRINRYLTACKGDTRKTMALYRMNLHLSQEMFTLLSCFEISLRNAIDRELTRTWGNNWLKDSISNGGIFNIPSCRDSARIISTALLRLNRNGEYSHSKLLAELEFGVWKYMFANPQFHATGRVLLNVFPHKPRSSAEMQYNNSYFFNELDGINILRNRIAHHEPICFMKNEQSICTDYILNAYQNLLKLFGWMGINARSLSYMD